MAEAKFNRDDPEDVSERECNGQGMGPSAIAPEQPRAAHGPPMPKKEAPTGPAKQPVQPRWETTLQQAKKAIRGTSSLFRSPSERAEAFCTASERAGSAANPRLPGLAQAASRRTGPSPGGMARVAVRTRWEAVKAGAILRASCRTGLVMSDGDEDSELSDAVEW